MTEGVPRDLRGGAAELRQVLILHVRAAGAEPLHFADTGTTRVGQRRLPGGKSEEAREAEIDVARKERLFQVIVREEKVPVMPQPRTSREREARTTNT